MSTLMIAGKCLDVIKQIKLLKTQSDSNQAWLHLESTFIAKGLSLDFIVILDSKLAKDALEVMAFKILMPKHMHNGRLIF